MTEDPSVLGIVESSLYNSYQRMPSTTMGPVMGRPARFDADQLLDEALALAAEGGPEAVTMAAVAQRAGAPSGSLYHRFAGRSALLAALWLRTVADFQAGYLTALLDDGAAPRDGAVAA